jgi:hypothetical protein
LGPPRLTYLDDRFQEDVCWRPITAMGGLQIGLSDGKEHHGWKPSTDKWFSTVVWKADNVVDPDGCCLGYSVCSLNII